jgi:hypothetical protein
MADAAAQFLAVIRRPAQPGQRLTPFSCCYQTSCAAPGQGLTPFSCCYQTVLHAPTRTRPPSDNRYQNAGASVYPPQTSRSAPQISPSVASALAAAIIGGIMLSSPRAAATRSESAASTAA